MMWYDAKLEIAQKLQDSYEDCKNKPHLRSIWKMVGGGVDKKKIEMR